ncbi:MULTISPECIES: ABC transporter ATP-binding protein [unclassified Pseudarthrobacter]|uniref:ABC transporter ATP-binding protein n=1 Tax=unclassified Pseudarthrobacter TaxID=2647000 RepID=UPI0030769893
MTGQPNGLLSMPSTRSGQERVLSVEDLRINYQTKHGASAAVRGISFDLSRGEVVGIVGESGCGKSSVSRSLIGLLPDNAQATGRVEVGGVNLIDASPAQLRSVRGRVVGFIPQDPLSSLNPVYRIGWQLAEAVQAHQRVSTAAALARAVSLLDAVGLPNPKLLLEKYPFQLSGGMRQRVVIAMALVNDPDVLIADEPTTALDVTVQAEVLECIDRVREAVGVGLVLVTHDLGVIAGYADRVNVMYAGEFVESGTADDIFSDPRMPYTLGLLASVPDLSAPAQRLVPIPGRLPDLSEPILGCAFADRCPMVQQICRSQAPIPIVVRDGHDAACHFASEIDRSTFVGFAGESRPELDGAQTANEHDAADVAVLLEHDDAESGVLLELDAAVRRYPLEGRSGLWRRRERAEVHALDGVDLTLHRDETVGIVGESGSGKSTLIRAMLGLEKLTAGEVRYRGRNIEGLPARDEMKFRRAVQVMMQDPFSSLDPKMTVERLIDEPLRIHNVPVDDKRVGELLTTVGLPERYRHRYPRELSGGERQRVSIARALALSPEVLILDEPVSALDVSIQAGILNVLQDLREQLHVATICVSHDLSVIAHISDRIMVMYFGLVIEIGTRDQIIKRPAHPYTQMLLSAVATLDPVVERAKERSSVAGVAPDVTNPPKGCRFIGRCPKYQSELDEDQRQHCRDVRPELSAAVEGGAAVACHFPY